VPRIQERGAIVALIRNSDPDLLSLVGEDVALRYVSGTRGGEYAGPCPFCHEGDDRLRVQPVTNMWYCRECARQGRMDHWEDDISYLRRRDGLGFADACKRLDIEFAPNDEHSGGYTPRNYSFPDLLPTPPCDEWVAAVSAVLAECEECLWSPQSRVTRDWLYQKRSIHEDTARKFRLGRNVVDRIIPGYVRHNERTQRDEPLTLRRGLVIPCYGVDGTLWGVKVKTSPAELAADPSMGRYTSVAGSQAGLQGILSPPRGGMPGRDRIFLCEGELDMIVAHQDYGDIADIATYGSAQVANLHTYWFTFLRNYRQVFLMYDHDSAGRAGARQLLNRLVDLYANTPLGTRIVDVFPDKDWLAKAYPNLEGDITKEPKDVGEIRANGKLESYVQTWLSRFPLEETMSEDTTPTTAPTAPPVAAGEGATGLDPDDEAVLDCMVHAMMLDQGRPLSWIAEQAGLDGEDAADAVASLTLRGFLATTSHPALPKETLYKVIGGPLHDDWMAVPEADRRAEALALVPPRPAARQVATPVDSAEYPDDEIARLLTDDDDNAHIPEDDADYYTEQGSSDPPVVRQMFGYETGSDRGEKVDNVRIVRDADGLREMISHLSGHKLLAVDTETTGLDVYERDMLSLVQIATPERMYVVEARQVDVRPLKGILEDRGVVKILQNANYDYRVLAATTGIRMRSMVDTMLTERILKAGVSRVANLEYLAQSYLGVKLDKGVRNTFIGYRGPFTDDQLAYSAKDVEVLFGIWARQRSLLIRADSMHIANLEFRTLVPVAEMQLAGCAIDKDKWRGLLDKAAEDRLDAQGRLVGLLSGTVSQRTLWGGVMVRQRGSKGRKDRGGEINLGSSQEMLERLREIGLSAVEDGDTATGEALMALESSEEQYLKTIEHPAARTLLEWRGYDKILSAFGENVLKLINPQTGRIHPEFQQLEADTGRFACIAAGQRVSVPGAQIPIEQITVGTPVYAFDDAGQPVIRPVIAVMDNGIRSCVEVRWKARRSDRYGSLTCTPDHLIRTQGKGWVAAGDLLPGDKPLFLAHSVLTVTPVGECHVYDLEVEDAHNFVAEELCVHNCRAPNVQQIPSDSSFRSCFVAPEGYKIVTADYSQAELRILCQLSGDERFTEAFNSGGDLHTLTAMQMYGVSEEHVKANKKLRSNAKCFHPDTEVLTRSGWRRIVDIDETVEVVQATPGPDCEIHLDWAYPLEVFSMEHPSGQLVHLRNEGIDIRVTPDHRMLAFNVNGDHKVVMPGEFGKVRTWANAGILGGHGFSTVPEHVLRLAVATQADGSYDNSGIRFGFSKERKVERLHYLLRGCAYTHGTHANGVRWFRIGGELAGLIKSELDDKCLPWRWVGSLTDIEKSIALDEIRHWDSHERGNWRMFRYSSMVEQNVDVLQALASLTGRKTRKVRSVSGCYNLTVRGTHTSRGGNVETTTIPYTDRVACLSVPSTFVLVRDGGVPVITGQTINFGLAYGQGPGRLAASLGLATKEEAQALIDQYFQAYSGIKRWLEGSARRAVSQGYIESIYGRKRYFTKVPPLGRNASKEARSEHRKAIGRIERQGKNTPIQACVHGDTRVFTEEHGYVAIRDLAGLQVTVWDGERFSHASVFPSGNKRLLTVHLTDGRSIRCSPEHRFWTRDVNGKSFWRTPSEFIQQTRIALADAIPERWSVPVPLPGVTERRVHNGKLIDMGMLGDPYERGIWLGRVASDGDCRNGNQVQLIVAEHEYELLPKLRDLCARFGHVGEYVTPRDAGRASMTRLSIASKGLAQQLCDAGLKRRIPAFVWAESETLRGYLRGLFDGDGGMSPDGATLTFGKAQGKRAWAEDVAEALLLFGIRSRVRSYAGDRTVVQVLKRDMPQFAARIGFLKASKQEMAESVTSSVTESIYGRCATVLRVDDHQEYVPMYDVVNSETGRFAASGLITHNSNADMTKFALCGIHAALEGYDARIVNTVHDEIVVEAREDVADEVMGIVQSEMVRAGQRMITRVPVEADAHVDDCWSKG